MNNRFKLEICLMFLIGALLLLVLFTAPAWPETNRYGEVFSESEIRNIESLCSQRHAHSKSDSTLLYDSCVRTQQESLLLIKHMYKEIENTHLKQLHISCEAISLTEGFMDYSYVHMCLESLLDAYDDKRRNLSE